MCSFIITPSILLSVLNILYAVCEQPGGNQTWALDLDDAAQRFTALQTKCQHYPRARRVRR